MTTPQIQNDPIYNLGLLYVNGLLVSNDATTPNTKLNISLGSARDSNNIIDITLGADNANIEGIAEDAPLVLDALTVGANGLDSGALVASALYAIYIIGDSRYYNPTACLATFISTSSAVSTGVPLMPFGYDSMRLIGYARTDGSSHFLPMYISGTSNNRLFFYDAPQISPISAGASTSYAADNLSSLVPNINNIPVILNSAYTPSAASQVLSLQPGNGSGNAVNITSQVTSVVVTTQSIVLAQPTVISTVSSPTINYKLTSGGAVAIYVAGFQFVV